MQRRPLLLASTLILLAPGSAGATDSPQITSKHDLPFDQPGTSLKDEGVAALALPDGRTLVVARVDINHPDTRIVGIGLARRLADGSVDGSFTQRVKDAGFSTIVGACRSPAGKIIVAGTVPHPSPSTGQHFALVSFNADGSDNPGFSSDGKLTWYSNPNLDYQAYGVSCGDGERMVIFGSERWSNGVKYAAAASFEGTGAAISSFVVAGASYNDAFTAIGYDGSIPYTPWLMARRSQRPDGSAEVTVVARNSWFDTFGGSIWTPPSACGGDPQRIGGFAKAADGSMLATLGSGSGARLWRFPVHTGSTASNTCFTIHNLDQSVGIPARLADGRIGIFDALSTLLNGGAHARIAIMKPVGIAWTMDSAVNGTGMVYWLHPSPVDSYGSTFAKSLVAQGTQFVVVGTKNYRTPDFDISITRIQP